MFTLRDYQQEATDRALMFFSGGSKLRPILELPTASGKSVIIAFIVKELRGNVVILQPSKELLEQNFKKYDEVVKDNPELETATVYSASVGVKQRSRVTFATIGSIYKNPEEWVDTDYVLVDECHNVSPQKEKLVDRNGTPKKNPKKASMHVQFFSVVKPKAIGLSASPYHLKTYSDHFTGKKYSQINLLNRETPRFFNDFLYNVSSRRLYEGKHLCPVQYLPLKFRVSELEFNSVGSEYTDASIKKAILNNKVLARIPDILRQAYEKGQNSCLVFVQSVKDAKMLSKKVPFSEYLHAKTDPTERAEIIANFKRGNIKTLFNVSVLTEGFDYPALDTVIVARPTMSLTLWVQMVGRLMRNAPGKTKGSLVDMCGNLDRFGKVEELRIEKDPKHGWVLRNDTKIISGRRLSEVVS